MRKMLFRLMFLLLPVSVGAQSYVDSVLSFQRSHINAIIRSGALEEPGDTAYLRFYSPDEDYRVRAKFVRTSSSKTIKTGGKDGRGNVAREYGTASFSLFETPLTLHVYKFIHAGIKPGEKQRLFVSFTDNSNGPATYHGGRYLEVPISDISDGWILIDFNKCYNPVTAYERRDAYFVMPRTNRLDIDIKAGEKKFGKDN